MYWKQSSIHEPFKFIMLVKTIDGEVQREVVMLNSTENHSNNFEDQSSSLTHANKQSRTGQTGLSPWQPPCACACACHSGHTPDCFVSETGYRAHSALFRERPCCLERHPVSAAILLRPEDICSLNWSKTSNSFYTGPAKGRHKAGFIPAHSKAENSSFTLPNSLRLAVFHHQFTTWALISGTFVLWQSEQGFKPKAVHHINSVNMRVEHLSKEVGGKNT